MHYFFPGEDSIKVEAKVEVKQEKITLDKQTDNSLKPPPDKKPKLTRWNLTWYRDIYNELEELWGTDKARRKTGMECDLVSDIYVSNQCVTVCKTCWGI